MREPALLDEVHEFPGGGTPGVGDAEDEEDEVGEGDEAFGDVLVFGDDAVGAGGIDDVEVAQERDGAVEFGEVGVEVDVLRGFAVFEEGDAVGGGEDVHAAKFGSKEGVEEGGFSGFDFAGDDEEEGFAELLGESAEGGEGGFVGGTGAGEVGQMHERGVQGGALLQVFRPEVHGVCWALLDLVFSTGSEVGLLSALARTLGVGAGLGSSMARSSETVTNL
jgi:hypothetical protein